jgi:hypothetical protein
LASVPTERLTQNSTSSLGKVRDALADRFPNTGVRVSCPAVVVPFGSKKSETTEVVLADFVKEEKGFKIYEIADCQGGWMRASPDAHLAYVAAANNRLNGKVKPLIRFLKAWKFYRDVPISSFYLELRVARYTNGESSIIYDVDVHRVLNVLWDGQLASMYDPMGVSGSISACTTVARKADALSKLSTAMTRAEKAVAARTDRPSDAFDWWRLVFNDAFPTYYY